MTNRSWLKRWFTISEKSGLGPQWERLRLRGVFTIGAITSLSGFVFFHLEKPQNAVTMVIDIISAALFTIGCFATLAAAIKCWFDWCIVPKP